MVNDRIPFPWRLALCVVTLGVGLALSLAYGHTGDAIVLAVLLVPGIALVLLWPYIIRKASARDSDKPG